MCVVVIPHTVVWGYLAYCVFVCTVTDFSAAKKDRLVKFSARVRLLSGQVFSYFGELWLAGSFVENFISSLAVQEFWRYIKLWPSYS